MHELFHIDQSVVRRFEIEYRRMICDTRESTASCLIVIRRKLELSLDRWVIYWWLVKLNPTTTL